MTCQHHDIFGVFGLSFIAICKINIQCQRPCHSLAIINIAVDAVFICRANAGIMTARDLSLPGLLIAPLQKPR